MERLTNKSEADKQRVGYNRRLRQGYPRNIPEERFLRLAEYEDTGMMPKEIEKLQEQNAILKELLRSTAEDAKGLFNACGEEYDKHDDISEPENCKFCKSYSDGGCKMNHECKWRYADKVEGVLKDEKSN